MKLIICAFFCAFSALAMESDTDDMPITKISTEELDMWLEQDNITILFAKVASSSLTEISDLMAKFMVDSPYEYKDIYGYTRRDDFEEHVATKGIRQAKMSQMRQYCENNKPRN